MLLWGSFLMLVLAVLRAEGTPCNSTAKAGIKDSEIETKNDTKPEASIQSESVVTRSGGHEDQPHSEEHVENVFKTREADGIVTKGDVQISGGKLSADEKRGRVEELVQDMVDMISDDIAVASQTLTEKGNVLSEKESEEFFQSVAENTMYRIKDSTVALNALVVDTDEVSKLVADRIAAKAARRGVEKAMNDESGIKRDAIDGSVTEITKSAQEFIKFALQSA